MYGSSAGSLGSFGNIVVWPLFISLAIITGNIWGMWNDEWKGDTSKSITVLRYGMAVFLAAVILLGASNLF